MKCADCDGTGYVPDSIDNYTYDPFCMAPCPSCSGSGSTTAASAAECATCRTRGNSPATDACPECGARRDRTP